jgi:hypothetical protein
MIQRLIVAISSALIAAFAFTGVSEASKGPDAEEIALATIVAVLVLLGFLFLMYGLRVAFGGANPLPPPEEPSSADHH